MSAGKVRSRTCLLIGRLDELRCVAINHTCGGVTSGSERSFDQEVWHVASYEVGIESELASGKHTRQAFAAALQGSERPQACRRVFRYFRGRRMDSNCSVKTSLMARRVIRWVAVV